MISAHAGTGKTWRLAHRFIGLLAQGIGPDRICALTFSRKAAGEIFDAIVEHLCNAIEQEDRRLQSAEVIRREGIAPPPNTPNAYRQLLRRLLDHIHRLRIGTLDSFLLSVVRAFPFELGVPPNVRPMDSEGGEASSLRRSILTHLLDPTRAASAEERAETIAFLRLFQQAYLGQEKKAFESFLHERIEAHYHHYLDHPIPPWKWGLKDAIWPPNQRWWEPLSEGASEPPADLEDMCRAVFSAPRAAHDCAEIIRDGLTHSLSRPPPKKISSALFARLAQQAADAAPPTISYYQKTYLIPDRLWELIRRAIARIVAVEVERSVQRTQGLGGLLHRYDRLYEEATRTTGRLTFEDLARLLSEEGRQPGRQPNTANRLYVDYRLDGQLDHWLLDEFQDTSNAQWSALSNLIDEIVQSPERSFFYVGDIKQSIYGWRGGNYRLFHEVWEKYQHSGPRRIEHETLAQCHRSLPAIIQTINAVFDGLENWRPSVRPDSGPRPEAVTAFARAWSHHESARSDQGPGYAALLEYDPQKPPSEDDNDEGEQNSDPAAYEAIVEILRVADPVRRGWDAAVLVRRNEEGRECVNVLRRRLPEMPVVHEGVGGILDHPTTTLLMALVRYAAHPGDTLALRHLQMSPLAEGANPPDWTALPAALLAELQERGFAETLRRWGARLAPYLDAFGRQRLRELVAAAEQFDASGERDADAFETFLAGYQVRSAAASHAVRVMTVHQSKGLGFDMVIVPFAPRAQSFNSLRKGVLLLGHHWALIPPDKTTLQLTDGEPWRARGRAAADADYDQLCVLYVALTRAKRALYMLIPRAAKRPSAVRPADLLRERLASNIPPVHGPAHTQLLYAAGDPQWYEKGEARPRQNPTAAPEIARVEFELEIPRREPSKMRGEGRPWPAASLFSPKAGDWRAFGLAIHRLFERIEWIEEADLETILTEWRGEQPGSLRFKEDVERQFRACVTNPDIRRRLSRPAGSPRAEVWREAPFNLLLRLDGKPWILSGRFDRLVVERDDAGRAMRATIFDYKSLVVETKEEIQNAAVEYAPQMYDYVRAAARLLCLPPEAITACLIFTRPGRLVVVHPTS